MRENMTYQVILLDFIAACAHCLSLYRSDCLLVHCRQNIVLPCSALSLPFEYSKAQLSADTTVTRQNFPGVDLLPAEWEKLKQVRHELEGWKKELRVNAHERQDRAAGENSNSPPLTVNQVVEQKIFHIYVDRPVVKERITTKLQRTFYEREYVKVVRCCSHSPDP